MKILCISDAWLPQVNGVVRTYQALQRELTRQGHELIVTGPADFPFTVPLPGYPEIRLALFAGRRLADQIRSLDPDAIHIATEGPLGRAGRAYCLKHKIPFTTCYHTRFPEYAGVRAAKYLPALRAPVTKIAALILRRFHAPAAGLMVVTENLRRSLETQGYALPIHIFPRGVDTELFRPGEKTEFLKLKSPVALCTSRLAVEKNLRAFLDAPWDGSKIVVGDGPDARALRQAYPGVTFMGMKTGEDLAACYRSADIFVFPSKTDTFGLVQIEALASGLPVAAFPVPGPLDVITSADLGSLGEDLPAAMRAALSSPGTPAGRAAHVAATYTWEAAAARFLAALVSARQTA